MSSFISNAGFYNKCVEAENDGVSIIAHKQHVYGYCHI